MDFGQLPIPALHRETSTATERSAFVAALRTFPVIETSRLKLRPFKQTEPDAQDVNALFQILGPPEVHRWNYIFKNGFSLADAETRIKDWLSQQENGTAIGIIVEGRATGDVIGEVHADFDVSRLVADISYATDCQPENRGKGYATEALTAFIDTLCDIGIKHLVLTAAPDNHPSQRVIGKLGIPKIRDVTLTVQDSDGMNHLRELFYLPATEWNKQ